MGFPPYYGVITASIIGYLTSFIYCILVLHFNYQIKFEEIVKNFIDILCGTFFMILILMFMRLIVPIPSPNRIINLLLIIFYGVIGMVVYFGYAHFNKLTNKIFGREIIRTIQKIFLKK
jgi:O-antigen/teichoic acid export membrane protein